MSKEKTIKKFIEERFGTNVVLKYDGYEMSKYEGKRFGGNLEDLLKEFLEYCDPPPQDLTEILRECRDLLLMCTLLDKSGQCKSLVDKIDINIK